MSQFGNLSSANQTLFLDYQNDPTRQIKSSIWVAGFGDIENVISISTFVGLETKVPGRYPIGRASIVVRNNDGEFFSDGKSNIASNAKIKVWTGFKRESTLQIPIFTGVVRDVKPDVKANTVEFVCADNMQIFEDEKISGTQDPDQSLKDIVETWAENHFVSSNIPNVSETNTDYNQPTFDTMSQRRALEQMGLSVFSIFYFDVSGVLQLKEKEFTNPVDWTYDNRNVQEAFYLDDSVIINRATLEFRDRFLAFADDDSSIVQYDRQSRDYLLNIINDASVASLVVGEGVDTVGDDLEAVRIDPSADGLINCVQLKLSRTTGVGLVTVKIYSDSSGPSVLLGTSETVPCGRFADDPAWETFYFKTPVEVSATTFWIALDVTNVTGAIQFKHSEVAKTGYHAVNSGSWSLENNKRMLHRVRGSWEAQRVVDDTVRFYKDPKDRIRIIAPGVAYLQRFDEVFVNVQTEDQGEIIGRYMIEERRHRIENGYTTFETLRKVG